MLRLLYLGRRGSRTVSVILGLIAVGIITAAAVTLFTDVNLRAHGVTTDAAVLNVSATHSRKGGTSYTDRIEFSTPDGARHDASISGSGSERAGGTVAVVYDPSDPGTVQPRSSLTGVWWLPPVVFIAVALIFGFVGWRMWRRASRVIPMQTAENVFG